MSQVPKKKWDQLASVVIGPAYLVREVGQVGKSVGRVGKTSGKLGSSLLENLGELTKDIGRVGIIEVRRAGKRSGASWHGGVCNEQIGRVGERDSGRIDCNLYYIHVVTFFVACSNRIYFISEINFS